LSQFLTPARLAEDVVAWSGAKCGDFVCEPSAGRGALVKPLLMLGCYVDAWEIDHENIPALGAIKKDAPRFRGVIPCDFLTCTDSYSSETPYSLAVMNPPYEGNQDVRFIERALGCSERVVGIFQSRILHSKGRAEFWRHHDIRRMAVLSQRPRFGGDHSAKTDFVVLEVLRRQSARLQGEATPTAMEWWA
jgi:predicted RNA methylase